MYSPNLILCLLLGGTSALINTDRWTTCQPSQLVIGGKIPWTAQVQFNHVTNTTSPSLFRGKISSENKISTVIQLDIPPCAGANGICSFDFYGDEEPANPYTGSLEFDLLGTIRATDPDPEDSSFYTIARKPEALHKQNFGRLKIKHHGWAEYVGSGLGKRFRCAAGTTLYGEMVPVGNVWISYDMRSVQGPTLRWLGTGAV